MCSRMFLVASVSSCLMEKRSLFFFSFSVDFTDRGHHYRVVSHATRSSVALRETGRKPSRVVISKRKGCSIVEMIVAR